MNECDLFLRNDGWFWRLDSGSPGLLAQAGFLGIHSLFGAGLNNVLSGYQAFNNYHRLQ
jgi:hypothetical protein